MDIWQQMKAEVLVHRRQRFHVLGEDMINRGADDFIRLVHEAMKTFAPFPRPKSVVADLSAELTKDPQFAFAADFLMTSNERSASRRQRLEEKILLDREERFRGLFSDTGVSEGTIKELIALAKKGDGF